MDFTDLLEAWDLSHLIPNLKENDIDSDSFKKLTSDLIKEIIPKVGPRIHFMEKYNTYRAEESQANNTYVSMEDDSLNDSTNNILMKDNIQYEILDIKKNYLPDEISSDQLKIFNNSPSTSTSVSSGDDPTLFYVRHESTLGMSDSEIANTPVSRYNRECTAKTGLEDLLNSTTRGKLILYSYQRNNVLLPDFRDKLVELLLDRELESDSNKKVNILRFEEMAAAIVGLFPSEYKEIYFRKTRKRTGGFVGGGKLFCKYYNLRKQLRLNGLIKTENHDSDEEPLMGKEKDPEHDEKVKEAYEWLKHNSSPWATVETRWKQTCKSRRLLLKNTPIHDYIKIFPILQNNNGYSMFNIDFEALYKDHDIFYLKWNYFASKVLEYAQTNSRDKTVKSLLTQLEGEHITEEGKNNRILKMLAHLVHPVAVCRKWKPSKSEVEDGFIMHIKTLEDLQAAIEARQTKLKNLKLSFQPTPIIIGEDLDNISICYVRVDDILYNVESPLKAVEVTFKAIHSLNALYPCEAEQVWLIIQQGLFNIKTAFHKQFLSVSLILPHLQ